MCWAPPVGVVLGLVAATGAYVTRWVVHGGPFFPRASALFVPGPYSLLPAVVGIAVLALLTRGMHLDGLADTADGLASYQSAQRSLEVMAKPDLGPLGAVTVLFVVVGQVAALAECIRWHHGSVSLVVAVLTGRLAMTLSCTPRTPAARPGGMGALVAGTVSRPVALLLAGLAVLAAAGLGLADFHSRSHPREAVFGAAAVIIGCGVAHLLRAHAVRRLGGITGDVLGALNEVATLVALLVLAGLH